MSPAVEIKTELGPHDLDAMRRRLLEERQRLQDAYRGHVHAGQDLQPQGAEDSLDMACKEADRETLFELSTAERRQLLEIEDALRRIEAGTFGICEHSQQPIPLERLQAVPWARFCTGYQQLAEDGLLEELG